MKKSFTLIELLIVLVIIGIIVALAYPRYEILVINSQGVEAMRNLRALADSVTRFYLETGRLPTNGSPPYYMPTDLDIKITPATKYFGYRYYYYNPAAGSQLYARHQRYYSQPESVPNGAIVTYLVYFCDSPTLFFERTINGEKVGDNMYRYYTHRVKVYRPSGWALQEMPGWPGGK